MEALNNLPKPVVIGVAIVVLVLACFFVFKTVGDFNSNNGYGSREEIMERQKGGAKSGGHAAPTNTTPPSMNSANRQMH